MSITLDVGPVIGGASGDLYDQLDRAGFNSRRRTCTPVDAPPGTLLYEEICGTPDYPKRRGPSAAFGLNALYAANDNISVRAGFVWAGLGGAEGFKLDWDRHNDTSWTSGSALVTVFWTRNRLRAGAGAGVFRLENTRASRLDVELVHQFGGVAELGFQSNTSSDVFIDSAVRLYVVPPKDLEFPTNDPSDPVLSLSPHWTHLVVSVGVGIRP